MKSDSRTSFAPLRVSVSTAPQICCFQAFIARPAGTLSLMQLNLTSWGHVGDFFVLRRPFFARGRLLRVCWPFLPMLVGFFAFGVAPGLILEGPRTILEGPKPHFLMFCRARRCALRKNSACAKTTIFPMFLHGFYTL